MAHRRSTNEQLRDSGTRTTQQLSVGVGDIAESSLVVRGRDDELMVIGQKDAGAQKHRS